MTSATDHRGVATERSVDRPPGRRWSTVWLAAVVISPLVVAAVALTQRQWYPVLDMAMTEFRVRDVGTSDTPLIGLPGRIGTFPDDQGSHPGPWSFYLIAPLYRLVGSTAYGMQLGSIVINAATIALTLWVVNRRGRPVLTWAVAALLAVAVRGYGLEVLTHPWNPYFPLLLWIFVLFATWSVLDGDRWMVLAVVLAGSVAAQTHVPYLLPCLAMSALALGVLGVRWHRGDDRREDRRAIAAAFALGALLWLAPLAEQLVRDPGNIRRLVEHFTGTPDEEVIGVGGGATVLSRHFDLPGALVEMFRRDDTFVWISGVDSGLRWGGLAMLAAWLVAAVVALRLHHRALISLHAVVAVATAIGWFSAMRIFGKVWYYLVLWMWGVALVAALATAWTAVAAWRTTWPTATERSERALVRSSTGVSVAVLTLATLASLVSTIWLEVPEAQISDSVGAVVGPTARAIDDGVGAAVGADGTYLVFWQDAAFIGSPGYGLVNELERRGYDVGVQRTWRTPVTEHRVLQPGEFDAEVHLVTGSFIDEWRSKPDHVEVATVDVRTAQERERYELLERRVVERLADIGRDEVIPLVTTNLFGADLAADLPEDVREDLAEMLELFQPVSVFLAPPGSV